MYLSCLLIDAGGNPDRPRPGRLWLRNLYHVHQRLCMAFPSASKISDDADFLKPFKPEDFGSKQVHVPRGTRAGFLFRIDPQPGGRAVILVQSAVKPNWDYAFRNACHLLACTPQVRPFDPHFESHQRLRFRLVANPTKKTGTLSKEERQAKKEGRHGTRVPVPTDRLYQWLADRAESAGFTVDQDSTAVQPGYIYWSKMQNGSGQRLRSVRYDGVLTVTDPARFQETLVEGIGSAKGFGFGLLSVALA
jgi:CRISPR system Cascade subunit CasE